MGTLFEGSKISESKNFVTTEYIFYAFHIISYPKINFIRRRFFQREFLSAWTLGRNNFATKRPTVTRAVRGERPGLWLSSPATPSPLSATVSAAEVVVYPSGHL